MKHLTSHHVTSCLVIKEHEIKRRNQWLIEPVMMWAIYNAMLHFPDQSSRDVTIIDINRLSVAKAFQFLIIDSQISLLIVFNIDNMLKLCVISLIPK